MHCSRYRVQRAAATCHSPCSPLRSPPLSSFRTRRPASWSRVLTLWCGSGQRASRASAAGCAFTMRAMALLQLTDTAETQTPCPASWLPSAFLPMSRHITESASRSWWRLPLSWPGLATLAGYCSASCVCSADAARTSTSRRGGAARGWSIARRSTFCTRLRVPPQRALPTWMNGYVARHHGSAWSSTAARGGLPLQKILRWCP
mmetsp:Transcript_1296/g.4253  ORF Transcript_1296/g.4253 Transcript_1296/m.4253 type:complete len:204 (+) Transcript_1296:445-1056(+)